MDSLHRTLDAYEVILSKQSYLSGDKISLTDLSVKKAFGIPPPAAAMREINLISLLLLHIICQQHAVFAPYFIKMDKVDLIEARPNVRRWWKTLIERKSLRETLNL